MRYAPGISLEELDKIIIIIIIKRNVRIGSIPTQTAKGHLLTAIQKPSSPTVGSYNLP